MLTVEKYRSLLTQKVYLPQFSTEFRNDDECLDLYFKLKFEASLCVWCGRGVVDNYLRVAGRKAFRCKSCHQYIYPLSDSAFRGSPVPMHMIFYTIFIFAIEKSSHAATEMSRRLGLQYKAMHRLMMLVRLCLLGGRGEKMKGIIEIDEAFLGKGNKSYNWSSLSTRKQPIIGLIERETKQCRLFLVPDRKASTIEQLVLNNVEPGSTIYTDSWRGYLCLSKYYIHESVDHSKREFVRGNVHTNSIENIWGQMKKNIRTHHIKITERYIQQYINEACWRHNTRGKLAMELFNQILVRTFCVSD